MPSRCPQNLIWQWLKLKTMPGVLHNFTLRPRKMSFLANYCKRVTALSFDSTSQRRYKPDKIKVRPIWMALPSQLLPNYSLGKLVIISRQWFMSAHEKRSSLSWAAFSTPLQSIIDVEYIHEQLWAWRKLIAMHLYVVYNPSSILYTYSAHPNYTQCVIEGCFDVLLSGVSD